ncbi:MAG: hypothetical protein Q4G35_03275 [Propionibacteriaceae bacterium]|nr:hypothetical protein [Propionibacteriaceae bacterium]
MSKQLMVVVDGVRYRLADAKRRGLLKPETPAAEPVVDEAPDETEEAEDAPTAGDSEGSGDPAGDQPRQPATRARTRKS